MIPTLARKELRFYVRDPRQRLVWTGTVIFVGLAVALIVSRALASMLYGVSAIDPLTYVAAPLSVACVAFLACYIPARRASRLHPGTPLRCE